MALRTGAAMPNIKKTTFQDLEIKVNENIEHQQRIAIELDTIQSTIDNKQQQLKELGELVKSRFICDLKLPHGFDFANTKSGLREVA